MVDFAGWELPVEFTGIIAEHKQVRSAAGLFDVSHMGNIMITGPKAQDMVQLLVTSDISKLRDEQISYTLMCYEDGGVVDDFLVYKYSTEKFMLVVNAANIDKDYEWMKKHQIADCQIENESDKYAIIALQGPKSEEVLQPLCTGDLAKLKQFYFLSATEVAGCPALVSRTGYTGERGFEIYLASADAAKVWQEILSHGGDQVAPIGLGARDTLRFETKLPLYGPELSPTITPLEAGLKFFVHLDKGEFIGRDALKQQAEAGLPRKLVEIEMVGRGIPRTDYPVLKDGKQIGHITTGAYAPTLDKNLGLALIDSQYAKPGEEVEIQVRKRAVAARVAKGLFYTPAYSKKRKKTNK